MKGVQWSYLTYTALNFSIFLSLLTQVSIAIVSIQDYCDSFPDTLRPVICILKEQKNLLSTSSTSTTRRPGWTSGGHGHGHGWGEESESESEESTCSCDLTCYPTPEGMNTSEEDSDLKCKPCGNHCDVTTVVNPKCSCAALGSGLAPRRNDLRSDPDPDMTSVHGRMDDEVDDLQVFDGDLVPWAEGRTSSRRSSRCSCRVSCAQTSAMTDLPFCIFNITDLQSGRDRRPVDCECNKSKAAENNNYPDFVCICQRV